MLFYNTPHGKQWRTVLWITEVWNWNVYKNKITFGDVVSFHMPHSTQGTQGENQERCETNAKDAIRQMGKPT